MKDFTEEEMAALGLGNMRSGSSEELVLDSDPTAHGLAAQIVEDRETFIENARRFDLNAGGARALGFDLKRLAGSSLVEIIGVTSAIATNTDAIQAQSDNIIIVDFARPSKTRLDSTSGTLVIDTAGGRASMIPFFPELSALAINLGHEIGQWISACEDHWLQSLLLAKTSTELPWQSFVAAGMLVRYREHRAADRKALVEALLAGQIPTELERERNWAKSLDSNTLQNLLTRGLTSVETLHHKLNELQTDLEEGQIITQADVQDILYLRDDIASGHLLLEAAGLGDPIQRALKHADELGESLLEALQEEFDFASDERLSRAAIANPEGWWTQVTALEE